MTTYLILVKHSVPQIYGDRPANTWQLSDEGRLRAQRLAEELKSFEPEIIFSSDEPKAQETAEIIAGHLRLNIQTASGFREHDRRNVPYLSHATFQASMRRFFQEPDQLVFGNETANQAHARFYKALHSILNENQNKTIVVVTHGTVISLFVA